MRIEIQMHTSSSPLQELIIERIERERLLTFAEYMQMALYEPHYGYYTSGANKVGWEGDFYTSTDLSDFFAHCMGQQLYRMWQQLRNPNPFIVLEQGAGRGALAQEVLAWAQEHHPDFYAALSYQTADLHEGEDALNMLTAVSPSPREKHTLPGVLLSNELVDAFPVHIIEKRGAALYEVYVSVNSGRLCEVLAEPSSPTVAQYLDTYKVPWQAFPDGWRAEVNLAALHWMSQAAQLLTRLRPSPSSRKVHGFLLTIDYGEKARALYSPDRYRGTLTCYFRHQLASTPLARAGQQDITAHVNFSALIDEGRKQGLRLQQYTTQRQWLADMGIHEELAAVRQRDFAIIDTRRSTNEGQTALFKWYNVKQRVDALTDPAGMGNFKVLILKC